MGEKRTGGERALTVASSPAMIDAIRDAAEPLIAKLRGRGRTEWLTTEQEQAIAALLILMDGNTLAVQRMVDGVVSHQTIWRVKMKNQVALGEKRDEWKRAAVVDSQEVFVLATAQVRDTLQDASARDAAVVAGIYAQRGAELAGDAVTTVRHLHSVDPAALAALTARLQQLSAVAEAPGEDLPADFRIVDG